MEIEFSMQQQQHCGVCGEVTSSVGRIDPFRGSG